METIYLICFGVGLLFTIISAFGAHLFGGHDVHAGGVGAGGHADAGFDHGGMPGMSPISPTSIASFITAFGGLGLVFSNIDATKNVFISAPLAFAGALVIAAGILWLFNQAFRRTQSSSESHVASLVGQTATIITPIPENGVGEIAYVQTGTRYTAAARAENGAAIPAGQTVKITRTGTQFMVTPA
ncbi:MAG: NfeD family protein [Verrucomicrobia bacterium]|nr:NfeD family protein [Verrucomicrobiota bacterium]